jgi:hypothetical protein
MLRLSRCAISFDDVLIEQVADSKNREEFIKDLTGKYAGVVAISRTFGSVDVFGF